MLFGFFGLKWTINTILSIPNFSILQKCVIDPLLKRELITPAIASNIHTILYVFIYYQLNFLLIARIIAPPFIRYRKLIKDNNRKQFNKLAAQTGLHYVSFLQSLIILYLSLSFLFDSSRSGRDVYPTAESRIIGNNRDTEVICLFALGYFIWDSYISYLHSTLPFVMHGIVSTITYSIGMLPFLQYYAPRYLMFELSNPNLNIRWFLNKYYPQDTNKLIKYLRVGNSLLFITTFFIGRFILGYHALITTCFDFYAVRNHPEYRPVCAWLIVMGDMTLNVLNVVWFSSMLKIARKVIKGEKVKRE